MRIVLQRVTRASVTVGDELVGAIGRGVLLLIAVARNDDEALASRMAHDLNNMLMILTGYGEELLNGAPAGSPLRGDVQEILAAAERMNGLTNHLLAFTRHPGTVPGIVSLETVLGGLQKRLPVELKLSSRTGPVKADAAQLEQALAAIVERAHLDDRRLSFPVRRGAAA